MPFILIISVLLITGCGLSEKEKLALQQAENEKINALEKQKLKEIEHEQWLSKLTPEEKELWQKNEQTERMLEFMMFGPIYSYGFLLPKKNAE